MDRGAWWATVHGVKELDTTELTYTAHTGVYAGRVHAHSVARPCPTLTHGQ